MLDPVSPRAGLEPISPYAPEPAFQALPPGIPVGESRAPVSGVDIEPTADAPSEAYTEGKGKRRSKQKFISQDEAIRRWVEKYPNLDPETLREGISIIDGRYKNIMDQKEMKRERRTQKIANEANRALIAQRKASTAKTEKETSLLGEDVSNSDWKKGKAIQATYTDESGNEVKLPYVVIPTSKGGGVTLPVQSAIPKVLSHSEQARYAEIMAKEMASYQEAITPPIDKFGQPDPDWNIKDQPDGWKRVQDMRAEMILSTHKILKSNGFISTSPPRFPSLVNPNKYLNAAPSTPKAEGQGDKNAEEKLSNILGGNRPTE
tara:strand:- start:886 stop:1842 length:957 start_codon:yes stop_codon:yes gene_type:complete